MSATRADCFLCLITTLAFFGQYTTAARAAAEPTPLQGHLEAMKQTIRNIEENFARRIRDEGTSVESIHRLLRACEQEKELAFEIFKKNRITEYKGLRDRQHKRLSVEVRSVNKFQARIIHSDSYVFRGTVPSEWIVDGQPSCEEKGGNNDHEHKLSVIEEGTAALLEVSCRSIQKNISDGERSWDDTEATVVFRLRDDICETKGRLDLDLLREAYHTQAK